MAQLDSASDSDSDGWRFESVWVRHLRPLRFAKVFFFAYQTDSVPIADAIDTSCNNRYYVRLAHYESVWVRHSKAFARAKVFFLATASKDKSSA